MSDGLPSSEFADDQAGPGLLPAVDWGVLGVVFTAALTLYAGSMSPVVFWGDSAEFALAAHDLELHAFARGYPLHRLLCWATGLLFDDPAFGANLISVVFGALTVALLFEAGRLLGGTRLAGFAAAATTALAHTFWTYSGVAEVYTLHTAFMAGAFVLLLRAPFDDTGRSAFWFGVLAGVSLLHHRMVFFAAPGLLCWLLAASPRGLRWSALLRAVLGFALGAIPFVLLCVFASRSPPPGTESPTLWWIQDVFLGGENNAGFLLGKGRKSALESAQYLGKWLAFNLPGVTLLVAALGFGVAHRTAGRGVALSLGLLVAVHLVFPFRYDWTGDQYAFLVPLYPIASLGVALGIGHLQLAGRRSLAIVAAVLVAAVPATLYTVLGLTSLGTSRLPGLEEAEAQKFFLPVRLADHEPEAWCRANMLRLPNAALVHCQWGDGKVYQYLQRVEKLRQDLSFEIWYGDRIPLRRRYEVDEWVSVKPGERELPPQVKAVLHDLEDRGNGLFDSREPQE